MAELNAELKAFRSCADQSQGDFLTTGDFGAFDAFLGPEKCCTVPQGWFDGRVADANSEAAMHALDESL